LEGLFTNKVGSNEVVEQLQSAKTPIPVSLKGSRLIF